VPDLLSSRCQACGKEFSVWALCNCPMCAKTVCGKCGFHAYGRTFCSSRCAALFFHGDDEDGDLPEA
jgi:hypothetical protein